MPRLLLLIGWVLRIFNVSSIPLRMNKIENIKLTPLTKSQYVRPLQMHFTQNGIEKIWDLMTIHDSVIIIVYNVTREKLIFVKQFRPAVYLASIPEEERNKDVIDTKRFPPELGITIELCAGIIDKNKPIAEIAREEVLEECGYQIPSADLLEKIISYRSGIGILGDMQTLFYVEVTDQMRVSSGGGCPEEGEFIELLEMSIEDARNYMKRETILSPGGFLFALSWFLENKAPQV